MAKFLRHILVLFFVLLVVAYSDGSLKTIAKQIMNIKKMTSGLKPKVNVKPNIVAKPQLQPKSGIKVNIGEQRMESLPKINKLLGEMPG
uniref:Hypothetical secreted peptide n=1 Tax=Simulium guianense TaxID=445764 RepID=F5GTQ6_SIMGU